MLEIIINNTTLDLPVDIEITLEMSNPILSVDRIPVPYTQSFEIPATTSNLQALENPNRVASSVDVTKKQHGSIRHSGCTLATGVFITEEANDHNITMNFQGAVFPEGIRKYLYEQDLGTVEFAEITLKPGSRPESSYLNTYTAQKAYSDKLISNAQLSMPDYVAAPLAIKGAEFMELTEFERDTFYSNLRRMRINSYRPQESTGTSPGWGPVVSRYDGYFLSAIRTTQLVKLLPSFRVGFILKKLLGDVINNNIFEKVFSKLMLITNYAPSYQTNNDAMVWDIKDDFASIRLADYMPDIPANEFISDVLKFPCATMFIKGGEYTIELNKDILNRATTIDWTNKLNDGFNMTIQEGEDYIFSVNKNSSDSTTPQDKEELKSFTINHAVGRLNKFTEADIGTIISVKNTDQRFEALPEPRLCSDNNIHWKLKLLSQSAAPVNKEESTRSSFDMSPRGQACRTVVVDYFCENGSYTPNFKDGKSQHIKCVMPEVEIKTANPERTEDLTYGIWHGMQSTPPNYFSKAFTYPLISHSNYLPNGTKSGDISLLDSDLVERYHDVFKNWIERNKKLINGIVVLTPLDLQQLDLSRKVHISGRNFFISKLSIPFAIDHIMAADVELIEA